MIDATRLLRDCQARVRALEAALTALLEAEPERAARLTAEHAGARDAGRTRRSSEEWRRERITQAAVAWVLGCVFVRFLEDTGLVETPRLAGPGERLRHARDQQTLYFRAHPADSAREYLLATFRAIAALPGCAGLFDERTNPLFALPVSGDAARELVESWRAIDPESGVLVHDFSDPTRSTRFLGDLYQDLSESAKKQYALLQTPGFIEAFILDRTLEPAIEEFGLDQIRLIDPACGSGHFLLGTFDRLLARWRRREPGTDVRSLVARCLAAISGVDLNPFAAEIARFRMLVAAVDACGAARLRDAPDLQVEIAVGDALLHGTRPGRLFGDASVASAATHHLYATEDADAIARVLDRRYHVVVANPPYITPKDPALNEAYRARFSACSGKYALSVPFMQLLFDLAESADNGRAAGYVGQITSNSFMKREFGRKLIEEHLARLDLTLIVDTSGAYIPGHGTPTVILVGRNRPPVAPAVRTVMGIRGEPTTPPDPSRGLVWSAIVNQVGQPDSESAYVTVEDVPRARYASHPWSIGGGGASTLAERLSDRSELLRRVLDGPIGFGAIPGEEDAFVLPPYALGGSPFGRALQIGDKIRDWRATASELVVFPYRERLIDLGDLGSVARALWPLRTLLWARRTFDKRTYRESDRTWWEWHQVSLRRLDTPRSIAFAEVATHNHFVLDRGGKVFKQTAPVITLPAGASEDEHLGLVGLLNSSTAEFWMRQMMQPRAGFDERWEMRLQRDGTKLSRLPLPAGRPLARARRLDGSAQQIAASLPYAVEPTRAALATARGQAEDVRAEMIALQEELDWEVYRLYGLVEDDLTHAAPPPLRLGERAFEIVLARRVAAGDEQTTWFERHGSTPITEVPSDWPDDYRALVERRISLIESDRDIGLIERPECKRRWAWRGWEAEQRDALRGWLLDRLEQADLWEAGEPLSCARLADRVRTHAAFREAAELYAGGDVDLARLVEELVLAEAVPYLAALRYTDDGLRVRAEWEHTWALQRREDAVDARTMLAEDDPEHLTPEAAATRKAVTVGAVPVPAKYRQKDFRRTDYWRLRGKLDVPKERFVLYPGLERAADTSPVVGWAGWDHLERMQALAAALTRGLQDEAWDAERAMPVLAGLVEQQPWVEQWHDTYDARLGQRVPRAFAAFVEGQLVALGLSREDLAAWRPREPVRARRRRVGTA
jgi:hypothetical protein